MANHRAGQSVRRISQLWQFPLFIFSVALFVYAGYRFIGPGPGATLDQKIAVAQEYLKQGRPDAAGQQLMRILETEKLPPDKAAAVHLLMAAGLEAQEKLAREPNPADSRRIIEHTELAVELGGKLDTDDHRRMAESFIELGRDNEAIAQFRLAIQMDLAHSIPLRRKLVELQLADDDPANADFTLDEYLKQPDLTDAERAWALNQRAGIQINQKEFATARKLLDDALRLDTDPGDQGQFNYQLGFCAYREGQNADAERYLRLARDQLRVEHPQDADAAYYLGCIYQQREDPATAISFYEAVLTSHPDARVAPLALLGRGLCRIMLNQTDAGLMDLHDLVDTIQRRPSRAKMRPDAIAGIQQAAEILASRGDFQSALETMQYEQSLTEKPEADFFARLAHLYEQRADQLDATLPDAGGADKIRRGQQVVALRNEAADAYMILSRKLTMTDDQGYADAMWKGIDLYDKAGNLQSVIASLEIFVTERPDDRLTPDALLRLGRAYQAAGLLDKAIDAYQRNQFMYPKSLAASRSAVPLARAYMAKGPDFYSKAEKTLLSVVENNPLVDPTAEEFRQALRELAQLYYRTGRYEEAVARLQELTERYPNDEAKPQMVFMMADSYRKSAALLGVAPATSAPTTSPSAPDTAEVKAAKRERLMKARALYDQVIELYRVNAAEDDSDRLYLKLSYFYRADCMYDLREYEEAIKLYDAAAFNYQNDPSSVAAYIQIVNAYFALGKPEEAKAANNRAKWMLQHMPAEAFQDGAFSMPKQYWDQWLQWASTSSGMFSEQEQAMADEDVLAALLKQLECYRNLSKLAQIQHEHVQNSRTQDLLLVLSQRQRVLEEIAGLEQTVGPVKKDFRKFLDGLPAERRTEAEDTLAGIRQLLEEITTSDRNDALVLQQRKLNLGKEINQAAAASRRNKTYAAAAYGTVRRSGLDIQR